MPPASASAQPGDGLILLLATTAAARDRNPDLRDGIKFSAPPSPIRICGRRRICTGSSTFIEVVKAATEIGVKLQSQDRSSKFRIEWGWGPPEKPDACISVGVDLSGDHGLLVLVFNVNRQRVVQSCTLARVLTRVGGGKWLVECPESGKMVQELYLDVDQQRFRSRHALKLRYRSKAIPAWERHWERCQKLMHRIGATHYHDLPPRPKNMRRATYQWLCEEIETEALCMYRAHLGESRFEEIETQALMHVLQHLGESE